MVGSSSAVSDGLVCEGRAAVLGAGAHELAPHVLAPHELARLGGAAARKQVRRTPVSAAPCSPVSAVGGHVDVAHEVGAHEVGARADVLCRVALGRETRLVAPYDVHGVGRLLEVVWDVPLCVGVVGGDVQELWVGTRRARPVRGVALLCGQIRAAWGRPGRTWHTLREAVTSVIRQHRDLQRGACVSVCHFGGRAVCGKNSLHPLIIQSLSYQDTSNQSETQAPLIAFWRS